jgi:hypothetical protein
MPIECMSELRLRKIANFEDLCKAMKVDDNGKPHREVKIFVWDSNLDALVKISQFYYLEEKLSNKNGRWYDVENYDVFVEDFEA